MKLGIPDPLAKEYVCNPFGRIASVLMIPSRTSPQLAGRVACRNIQMEACYEIPLVVSAIMLVVLLKDRRTTGAERPGGRVR